MSVPLPDSLILRLTADAIRAADTEQLQRAITPGARCTPRPAPRPAKLPAYTVRIRPPNTWHPGPGTTARPATQICRRCPVITECGLLALTLGRKADHGIWGGLTRTARRRLHRQLAPYLTHQRPT